LGQTKGSVSKDFGRNIPETKPGNLTTKETADTRSKSFVSEHLGRQKLIKGGVFSIPAMLDGTKEQTVQIDPFYMDEFFVTNQQFVDFLNHNRPQISIESGVVKGGGTNWFLLGEVRSGYEPIVYRSNEFHVSDPAHASSPVLRVTGYGASAFASYFGRRLPTEVELLYAVVKGVDSSKVNTEKPSKDLSEKPAGHMTQMMGDWRSEMEQWQRQDWGGAPSEQEPNANNRADSKGSSFLLSAASFSPNLLGIKGLNHEIGEWVYRDNTNPSGTLSKTNRYAVVGGVEGEAKDKISLPAIVGRFPWEGLEEIGFRTVKSAAASNSAG
jgi:serine/threonine-protein kinase